MNYFVFIHNSAKATGNSKKNICINLKQTKNTSIQDTHYKLVTINIFSAPTELSLFQAFQRAMEFFEIDYFDDSNRKTRFSLESVSLKNHFDAQQRRTSVQSTRKRSRKLSLQEKAVEKKRKQMVYIVVGIFLFILFSCVLVVIVTLTMTHHTDDMTRSNVTLSQNYSRYA